MGNRLQLAFLKSVKPNSFLKFISVFFSLLPPETYQRYARKTLGTKTILQN